MAHARKSPYEVGIELTKLILIGTRITYQATGDASFLYLFSYTSLNALYI